MLTWLDLLFLVLIGLAAARGFSRGFIIELCSLLALWVGVYAALHFSDQVSQLIGLDPDKKITAFVITFVIVLLLVHLLARALTTLIDIALLGMANKVAGIGMGVVRSIFMLSITLNLLIAYSDGSIPPADIRSASLLAAPIRSLAPILLPALGETKWVKAVIEDLKEEAEQWKDDTGKTGEAPDRSD